MRKRGFYEKCVKRLLDIVCSTLAIVVFSWLYLIIAILVRVKLGSPVLFKQARPGLKGNDGRGKIFDMYKFRTMTDERDRDGKLKSDEERLTSFGRKLRETSLDELAPLLKEAQELLTFCKARLLKAEEDINKTLSEGDGTR